MVCEISRAVLVDVKRCPPVSKHVHTSMAPKGCSEPTFSRIRRLHCRSTSLVPSPASPLPPPAWPSFRTLYAPPQGVLRISSRHGGRDAGTAVFVGQTVLASSAGPTYVHMYSFAGSMLGFVINPSVFMRDCSFILGPDLRPISMRPSDTQAFRQRGEG